MQVQETQKKQNKRKAKKQFVQEVGNGWSEDDVLLFFFF